MLLLFHYAAVLSKGKGRAWRISSKRAIPEFAGVFPGIDLVSIIFVRYCSVSVYLHMIKQDNFAVIARKLSVMWFWWAQSIR